MIKKLICPTDFSEAADNAVEYAVNLAKAMGAELLLVNVQTVTPVSAAVSLGEGIGSEAMEGSRLAAEKLKVLCREAKDMFQIEASYEVDVTSSSLIETLSSHGENNCMIVMGTNGVDSMYQYFFGSNAYQVIKNTKCPVLVVPEGATYEPLRKIVFAWDYSSKSEFSFSLLSDLRKAFDPKFVFLHVSTHQSGISHDLFRALKDEIETVLQEDKKVEFKQLFADDIPDKINDYVVESKADLLSITYYNRGFIRDIFHGTVAKELSETAGYPILVLHA